MTKGLCIRFAGVKVTLKKSSQIFLYLNFVLSITNGMLIGLSLLYKNISLSFILMSSCWILFWIICAMMYGLNICICFESRMSVNHVCFVGLMCMRTILDQSMKNIRIIKSIRAHGVNIKD